MRIRPAQLRRGRSAVCVSFFAGGGAGDGRFAYATYAGGLGHDGRCNEECSDKPKCGIWYPHWKCLCVGLEGLDSSVAAAGAGIQEPADIYAEVALT